LAVEDGLWLPVQRALGDRWLDCLLVVDAGVSMSLWRERVDEFRALLVGLAVFRGMRSYRFDGDSAEARLRLVAETGPLSEAAPAGHDPHQLIDATGRSAVIVVSDCVGGAWTTGAVDDALQVWGSAGPVAVVHMLPQRLWPACGPETLHVRLSASRRAVANVDLDLWLPRGADLRSGAVPVPVLELDPRWLRPWAQLVASPGGEPVPFTVLLAGPAGDRSVSAMPSSTVPGPEPEELLHEFREVASIEAMHLLQWLAAAPLTLPVMRLVQQSMLPDSSPSVLAEVFLSGLLHRCDAGPGDMGYTTYDLPPAVRDALLAGLPRHEQLAVLAIVSPFLAQRLGMPDDLPACLSGRAARSIVISASPAYSRVALRVLSGLGGRYAAVAARLAQDGEISAIESATPGDLMHDLSEGRVTDMQPRASHGGVVEGATAVYGTALAASAALVPSMVAPSAEASLPALYRDRGTERRSPAPRHFGGVPFRNPHFTGRVELLERLHAMLRSGSTQMALLPHALHGLGGVGKTQVAIEYAWRYAAEYDLVWWIRAESLTTVRSGLVELGDAIGFESALDTTKQVANVREILQQRTAFPRWLLVFDNANAPEELRGYLPAFGHVLVTSRNPEWAEVAEELQVDVFTREESIALLQRRGEGITAKEAGQLAARLGDLPLALDQAAAWQAMTGAPVAQLDQLLSERMAQLMSEKPPGDYPVSLMATWDLAFGELRERSPGAAKLLELLAFFGPDPIAVPLLQEGRSAALPDPLASVLRDEILLRRAIREIGRYALAKPNAGKDEIEIHRLVQAVLREQLSAVEREETRDAVHRVMGAANPGYPDYARTWARHAQLLPHVTPTEVIHGRQESGWRVALDQIRYRYQRADYERSVALGESVVAAWRATLGLDHELTLVAQRHLATSMRELGDYEKAAALNQDTLERMRRIYGDDHEHTLATLNSVGRDLRLRAEYAKARALDEDSLARHRRRFGRDEPTTLQAQNNLAVSLRWLGEAQQALSLDQDCYDVRQGNLGPDHASTLLSLANVGRDLADAGHYTEALTLLTEAMPRIERLGAAHRVARYAQFVVAMVLRRSGDVARAREVAEENFLAAERTLSAGHEQMLSATLGYANALAAVGEVSAARPMAERAHRGYERQFGLRHPLTLVAAVDLAVILRADGDPSEALALDTTSLEAFTTTLGERHPFTLVAMINLAHDLAVANDFVRARELSGRAYDLSREVRGDVRPETLICGLNHALDLRATGETDRAAELFERMQSTLQRDYGTDHPATRAAAKRRRAEADLVPWET
jgi:tetratricopeptide (TPR) repeat protein